MKKILGAALILAGATLTGCQTAGNVQTLASSDFSTMSCESIQSVFAGYESDNAMADSLTTLMGVVAPSTTSSTNQIKAQTNNIYNQARKSANAAMQLKGCSTRV